MNTTKKTEKTKKAMVFATTWEIFCPVCNREDPIPSRDGSFFWDGLPFSVKCPDCGKVSILPKRESTS